MPIEYVDVITVDAIIRTLMLLLEDNAPLYAVLYEVHERAREPAPVCEPSRPLTGFLPDETELRERRRIVREPVHELEQHGGRRVQEGVQQRLLLALLRPGRVGVRCVLSQYRGQRGQPVEEDEAFPGERDGTPSM